MGIHNDRALQGIAASLLPMGCDVDVRTDPTFPSDFVLVVLWPSVRVPDKPVKIRARTTHRFERGLAATVPEIRAWVEAMVDHSSALAYVQIKDLGGDWPREFPEPPQVIVRMASGETPKRMNLDQPVGPEFYRGTQQR